MSSTLDRLALAKEDGGEHSGRNREVFHCHSAPYMSSLCGLGIGVFNRKRNNTLICRIVHSGSEMGVINKVSIPKMEVTNTFILDAWSLL